MSNEKPNPTAGTTDDRPRWEGPEESRPRGYKPAKDDPSRTTDAAGETNDDPSRDKASDVFKKKPS